MLKQLNLFQENESEISLMQLNRFKTPYNALRHQKDQEVNHEPSKTIPDQSMSLKEILDRHSKGLPVLGERVPIYHGEDEFFPNTAKLDLAEQQELKNSVGREIERVKATLEAIKSRKAEEARVATQNASKPKGEAPTPQNNQADTPPPPSGGGKPA